MIPYAYVIFLWGKNNLNSKYLMSLEYEKTYSEIVFHKTDVPALATEC